MFTLLPPKGNLLILKNNLNKTCKKSLLNGLGDVGCMGSMLCGFVGGIDQITAWVK